MQPSRILITVALVLVGCSPAARTGMSAGVAGTAPVAASQYETAPVKLMIFGGEDHRTYLGCLNCSQYATDSVFNEFGSNGSRYSSSSIWNAYSSFGSAYSSYGACNAYATDPPVIVGGSGKYYGRLTLNTFHPEFGAGANYYNWLKHSVCGEE
jgi:hypothetical protein